MTYLFGPNTPNLALEIAYITHPFHTLKRIFVINFMCQIRQKFRLRLNIKKEKNWKCLDVLECITKRKCKNFHFVRAVLMWN